MADNIRVLFIEDDLIDQQAFIRAVTRNKLPYVCTVSQSLGHANACLTDQVFDIVICDYVLGDGTAVDIIEAWPEIPFVVITGAGDETIAAGAMKAGARDYLVKDSEGDYLKILPKTVASILRAQELEKAERKQRVLADMLHNTSRLLNSTLDLDEVLKILLENIRPIVPHDRSNVMLIEGHVARTVQHNGWSQDEVASMLKSELVVRDVPHLNLMYQTHSSCIIGDIASFEGWQHIPGIRTPLSYLAIPVCVDDEVIGFLNLDSMTPNHFTTEHTYRLQAFVNHAAIAVKNARLYKVSRNLAAMEERQRLARDLHDSVTQTLFAASVTANALIKQWQQDHGSIGEDLVALRDLTQGALAEMRTLLLELRPHALLETNLSDLLRQLTETIKGRSRIPVHFGATGQCSLPPEVHIAFFRIAQEAVNNVLKHARARSMQMNLSCSDNLVEMVIQDDGLGFDPAVKSPRQFGITIMKERAEEAGIDFQITTSPGKGTSIKAVWQSKEQA